ncbi:MAG: hypothetical protein ABI379_01100 [Rhodanobacter sp.]
MFKKISVALWTVTILVVVVAGIANAGVTNLQRIVVTASTSDNFKVFLPSDFIPAARLVRDEFSISDTEYVTDLTKSQVCQMLREHPPQNCTTSNYPASPGIPSASGAVWAGNGCGTGPFATAFLSAILARLDPQTYSKDLNKPVKNNPSIDFTSICSEHDGNYTSSRTKSYADARFESHLEGLCAAALSDVTSCMSFKSTYVWTVKTLGTSAYEADQQQLVCSVWGDSMKQSGCS